MFTLCYDNWKDNEEKKVVKKFNNIVEVITFLEDKKEIKKYTKRNKKFDYEIIHNKKGEINCIHIGFVSFGVIENDDNWTIEII